jgi:WD40 repeat protein
LKGIGKLAVSRDGSLLATLTGFGTSVFEVWNLSDGTAKRKIELPNPVQGMAISSDNRFLAATHGKSDGPKTFSVWNLETGEAVAEHEVVQAGESRFSGDVQFSSDGKQAVCSAVVALASIDVDSGELRLLEVSKAATFEGAYFGNIACSPTDGNIALAVVGGNGSSIQIRDLGSFEESVSIKPRVTAMKLGFSLDGKTFVAVCASGEIRAWNASTGEATAAIKDRTARIVLTQLFSVSPDGRFAVSRALNPSDLYIWDLGEETRLELGPDMVKIRFRDFTFMPGGRLAGAAFGQSIQFFDVTKLKPASSAK